jgi:hypothetical protein
MQRHLRAFAPCPTLPAAGGAGRAAADGSKRRWRPAPGQTHRVDARTPRLRPEHEELRGTQP